MGWGEIVCKVGGWCCFVLWYGWTLLWGWGGEGGCALCFVLFYSGRTINSFTY